MLMKRFGMTIMTLGLIVTLSNVAARAQDAAQHRPERLDLRSAIMKARHLLVERAKNPGTVMGGQTPTAIVDNKAKEETATDTTVPSLVGTWNVTVPGGGGDPGFYALQTFNIDGTFTETSSLLATLTEGPAHGVWQRSGPNYLLTFELFAFDDNHEAVGRIRVRNIVRVSNDKNSFRARSTIDIIELNGNEIPAIATGNFSATRMPVRQP